MLRVLRIQNIAVAKDIEIEFGAGFSVITGETGAGKSVLLDGISLVLGGRISKDMIRAGESSARVSAIFSDAGCVSDVLADYGISPDSEGEIEIIRTFTSDGKSTSKINGKNASVTALREIGGHLLSISSQAENRMAGQKGVYSELLDAYSDTADDLARYCVAYGEYTEAEKALGELEDSLRDRAMMTDILTYQLKEINDARLNDPGEEEKLEKQRSRLKDAEKIIKHASLVVRALSHSEKGATASYLVEKAQGAVEGLSGVLDGAGELAARLESIRYELLDIADQVDSVVDPDMENPDAMLDRIESRLDKISKLEKKYGADIPAILRFRDQAAEKLGQLGDGELAVKEQKKKLSDAYSEARRLAGIVSQKRRDGAKRLSEAVVRTLRYLDIPKALFEIRVTPRYLPDGSEELSGTGFDDVAFMFTANSGYPLQEMSKIASGGELSRAMLALKCELSAKQGVKTVIFDEIDTGVSGASSERIGLKLRELSGDVQVICVTHSPQVASLGDSHYLIKKTDTGDGARSSVRLLASEERIAEIARIIGGVQVTSKQIQAAGEMLGRNARFNEQTTTTRKGQGK